MKNSICFTLLLCACLQAAGQRLTDRSGKVIFYSEAPLENIRAENKQALAALDLGSGAVAVSMLMKGFRFKKSLMEEHFNENYVESDRYPKAQFRGELQNYSPDRLLSASDTVGFPVSGSVTVHGVTQPLTARVVFSLTDGRIAATTRFILAVADFDIQIPSLLTENIAEEVEVSAFFNFKQPDK